MSGFGSNVAQIACCICGTMIEPNPSNMCIGCLRQKANFADQIPSSSSVIYCRSCGRYQNGPTQWSRAEIDSPELLEICLKRLNGIKDMTIKDAKFLFTEPHSRRIRISLTVEKDAFNGTILRQTMIVTFVVNLMQCPACVEAATPREHWIGCVQLRTAAANKRTLYWIEQQILKHKAHSACSTIQRRHDGIDFHFPDHASSTRFANFLKTISPAILVESNKLMGEDIQSGVQDRRFTTCIRVPPITRQDLFLLPQWLINETGNQSHFALCTRMAKNIQLIDPFTARTLVVDSQKYWNNEFQPIVTIDSLRRFNVITIEPIGPKVGRFQLADVEITDEETFSDRLIVRTHLGAKLVEGESCLAYDLRVNVLPDDVEQVIKRDQLSVVIVGRARSTVKKHKKRVWHLKELAPKDSDEMNEFEDFLDEIEDDEELRQDIPIYRNNDVDENDPEIRQSIISLKEMQIDDGNQYVYAPDPYGDDVI